MSLNNEAAPLFSMSVCWGLWFCFKRLYFVLWVHARHVLPMTEKTSRLLWIVAGMDLTHFNTALLEDLPKPDCSLLRAASFGIPVTRQGCYGVTSTSWWTSTGLFFAAECRNILGIVIVMWWHQVGVLVNGFGLEVKVRKKDGGELMHQKEE